MTLLFWPKWHRAVGLAAALFLLFASVTGVMLAFSELFGTGEAQHEGARGLVSPVTVSSLSTEWSAPLARAIVTVFATAGGAPIDTVTMRFKGEQPTVTIVTGKPGGGEDREFVIDARTGALLRTEAYADKPLLIRLHSGAAFGDGGLVLAMLWGTALFLLTISGLILYWKPRP